MSFIGSITILLLIGASLYGLVSYFMLPDRQGLLLAGLATLFGGEGPETVGGK